MTAHAVREALPARRARVRLPFKGQTTLRLGLAILLAMMAVGVLGRVALPSADQQDLANAFAAPGSPGHLLGTDQLGRDVLAWISDGIWIALAVALGVVVISSVVGVAVGLCAGYFGGVADMLLMRLVDLSLAIPPLILFLAAAAVLRTSIVTLILLISAVSWLPYARLVRSVTLLERERGYVITARLAGASRTRILVGHLLPSVSTVVLVLASLQVGYVLLWESGLSFLGLGVRPPHHSLGYIIAQGRDSLQQAWWVVVLPGAALALLVLAANLIGDGLRDLIQQDVEVAER
ncbi:MAG TPA: ABC transporter permease [Conexibacter sp.]|jgi:peptide/nickel transport system permease protein|nr:ABC transporter permease [Conexibacter sp.]